MLEAIAGTAAAIRDAGDAFVLAGVGGSNQAARAAISALGPLDGPEVLYAGNTISPHSLGETLRRLEGRDFTINVIAKNFETLEPGIAFRALRGALEKKYGGGAAERIVVTGTEGGGLHALARERGWRFFPFPRAIGGRYSALSCVGLLPMAAAGIDPAAMVRGAAEMRRELLARDAAENPALCYAALRNFWYRRGRQAEMLCFFEPRLFHFSRWWVQLFAESEGKEGKGLLPLSAQYSEDLHSIGQFVQEGADILFETFIRIGEDGNDYPLPPSLVKDGFEYLEGKSFQEINRAAEEATMEAHGSRLPILRIDIPRLDAYNLGALFYFFEFSCYLSGRMLGINPFDQLGVEAYKQSMFKRLGKPI
jgi:glucose-6-phosphate isomerase